MHINPLYQSNYYNVLLLSGGQNFTGENVLKQVTVSINSFEQIQSIKWNTDLTLNFKTDFKILEALDSAKLKLYLQIINQIDSEQVRNNLIFRANQLLPENRVSIYLKNLKIQNYTLNHEQYIKLLDWYKAYNTKFEYIDIIEFVFYLENLSSDRLDWCLANYQNKPEILFD